MADIASQFAKLTIDHDSKPANADAWAQAVSSNDPGFSYELTKTAVFKPKVGKTQQADPIVLIALKDTPTPAGLVAKSAGVKECRFAAADFVAEVACEGADPLTVGPFSFEKSAERVKLVLDSKIAEASSTVLAVRSTDTSKTAFIESGKLVEYLKSIKIEPIVTDFAAAPAAQPAPAKQQAPKEEVDAKLEGAALIGITVDKEKDFSGWYQQVLTKGEMLEYYDVSGCYIMRPNSFTVWERVQEFFNKKIKTIGTKNCSFPLFVSQRVLEKEKDHIEGFAPEVAWVTKAGNSELEEHIAIRPTSETVMYPYYAKWIRSHRDLPLRLNQWNSVVRWEFKHPQPFLRTREFLWQEGHTVHLTKEKANEEVLQILDWYADIYEQLLAVPVVKGHKTDKERFAGSLFTTTVEGYIPTSGRGIQGGTAHCLGQNFSKMFNISVEDPDAKVDKDNKRPKLFCWQNSWGLSTRVIGVMVMTHSDNKGLVLPPRVADTQVVVIPCGLTAKTSEADRKAVMDGADALISELSKADVRVEGDFRDSYTPGYKFGDAELRGVPLRIEIGPADVKKQQIVAVRRDTSEKQSISLDKVSTEIPALLDTIQKDLYNRAKKSYDEHVIAVDKIEDFVPNMNKKNLLSAPFCGEEDCEDDIKERTTSNKDDPDYDDKAPSMGAKSLCIPFEKNKQPPAEGVKCVGCGKQAKYITQFGRSY